MIQIHGFNNKELNKFIREKDRIKYNKVLIHPFLVKQIREKQIGEVVELFCLDFLPNKDPADMVNSYAADLGLPVEKFRQCHSSLIYINEEILGLRKNSFISYQNQGDFIKAFYSLDLWNKLKSFPEENFPELRHFHEKVKELSLKLIETRKLLNQDDVEMVDASIEDILSETLSSPWEIWKEYDSHNKTFSQIFSSKAMLPGKKRLMVLVSERGDHGKISSMFCRRPYFEHDNAYSKIYGAAYGFKQ